MVRCGLLSLEWTARCVVEQVTTPTPHFLGLVFVAATDGVQACSRLNPTTKKQVP